MLHSLLSLCFDTEEMIYIYLLIIFVITFLGGSLPLVFKKLPSIFVTYMLAFTGAFLLGITVLHLMPEAFHQMGGRAGIYIIVGFCLQVFSQEFSHGAGHGHAMVSTSSVKDHSALPALLFGLSIHAFMEGIPLGYHYGDSGILPSLALAISFHKIPESFTLMSIVLMKKERLSRGWLFVGCFAATTPLAALSALYLGDHFMIITHLLQYIIAMVIGSFLYISTTIFYESGTRHHELSMQKVIVIMLGFLLVMATLAFE